MPVNSFKDYPMSWKPERRSLGKGPMYLALAAKLEADIVNGTLQAGTRLPPQRELADFLDINFTTVTRAYNLCKEKGLLYGVIGSGSFVAPNAINDEGKEEIIDLGVVQSFPEIGGKMIVETTKDVLEREYAQRLFSYDARDGMSRHRAAGCQWLNRYGVVASADNIAVFPGTQSAISSCLLSIFKPGEALAVDDFTYANLIQLARLSHVRLVPVSDDGHGMRPDALEEAVDRYGVKGAYVMPNYANPTTVTMTERRKDEIASLVEARNLLLLEDDARILPPGQGSCTIQSRVPERTIYFCGSTRCIASGLRVSYLAYPESCAKPLLNGLHHLSIKASSLDADILGELLISGVADRILQSKNAKAIQANDVFDDVFGRRVNEKNSNGMFRVVPLPGTAGRGKEIETSLLSNGIRVCHSDRFCVRKRNTESFLRISVSSSFGMGKLRNGLNKLKELLVQYR